MTVSYIFKISDITISRVVPGISSIQFHILEFFCVLVLLPQHSGVLDKLTGGHLVLGVTPYVTRHTNSDHVLITFSQSLLDLYGQEFVMFDNCFVIV